MKSSKKRAMRSALFCALSLASVVSTSYAGDLKFSGFLQVGGGLVDDDKGPSYQGYSEEDLTFNHNIIGIQATGNISDQVSATVQLVARGEKDYQTKAEWAYLTYQVSDSAKVRAGRLRTPFYMYSDFLDVGYAYAWIAPPREVYYLPFNNIDGVDFYKTGQLGSFDTTFQAYIGTFNDSLDLAGTGVLSAAKTRNQMGVAGTLGKDWWTLRAAYHQADLSIDVKKIPVNSTTTMGSFASTLTTFGFGANADKLLVEEDKATFTEVGLNIDTGNIVGAVEFVEFDPRDSLLSKNVRSYVMAGYRHNDWLFHITKQQSKDEASHPETGIPVGVALPVVGSTNFLIGNLKAIAASQAVERDVLTLGVRWDVTTNTALKFQLDDVDDDQDGKQKVFSVAVQAVF